MRKTDIESFDLDKPKLLKLDWYKDHRGAFAEIFQPRKAAMIGFDNPKPQDNISYTEAKGTVRGLHWQKPPHEQGKFVTVLRGRVWDVVVDIRPQSETFGLWAGVTLDASNQFWVPPGYAHGFQTVTDDVLFLYKCSSPYVKEAERSINPNDPDLGIEWSRPVMTLSEKDADAPSFAEACK